jgi:uncharacterized protein (TIGR04222 family)
MTGLSAVEVARTAFAVVVVVRVWVCRGANSELPGETLEFAYVNGGPRLVLFTCLAELRRLGLVDTAPQWLGGGIVPVEGRAVPADASALDRVVLAALPEHRRVPELFDDQAVAEIVGGIGARLVQRGWLISAATQSRMRWYALPGWLVAVWCLVQFGLTVPHFGEAGRPLQALGLLGLGVFLAIGTYVVVDVPPATRAGRAALRRARAETPAHHNAHQIAVGGEHEFWRDGQEFAWEAGGVASGKAGPMPHLMTHRHDLHRGLLSSRQPRRPPEMD